MSIITWIGERVLHPGNMNAAPRKDSPAFNFDIEDHRFYLACPWCTDRVIFAKGNECKCGRLRMVNMKDGLWAMVSSESKPTKYVGLKNTRHSSPLNRIRNRRCEK